MSRQPSTSTERNFDDPFAGARGTEHEEGETETEEVLAPPTSVAAVRATNTQIRLASYLQDFDQAAGGESIVLCTLPSGVVDDGSRAQLLAAGIEKEDAAMRHKNDLLHIDELKRNRLKEMELYRRQRRSHFLQQLSAVETLRASTNNLLKNYYESAQRELLIHLTSRQGEVAQSIGEIRRFNRGEYDPNVPDWTQYEQQVELKIVKIRGLKDKIPAGKYVVLVSKWDKLGGTPLKWNNRSVTDKPPPPCPLHPMGTSFEVRAACEVCNGWAGCTMPIQHSAEPRTWETPFESRLFTFFLPQRRIRPYNSLLFELVFIPDEKLCIRMKRTSGQDPRPQVVGFSVLPIVDSQFVAINGRFRIPMLRGLYTDKFGQYKSLQEAINHDLENWLGNLYLEIFPHAREHFGRNEFQLQSEFTMQLLSLSRYPSSKDPEGWPSDGRKRGASIDASANGPMAISIGGAMIDFNQNNIAQMLEEEFPYVRPLVIPELDTPALTRWNMIRIAVKDRFVSQKRKLQEQQREAIRRLEMQKQFRYSIHPYGTSTFQSVWRVQVEYCIRAIMDELSLRDPLSFKFWINVFVMVLMFYLQLFIHGIFIFISLYWIGAPVSRVEPSARGFLIDYNLRNNTPLQELMIVFVAMISTYALLLFEITMGYAFKKGAGSIPEQLSRFVFTTTIASVLVPLAEIIFDWGYNDHRSDFYRLHDFMKLQVYGDYFTYIIFFLVYVCLVAGCIVSTFLFTMNLHLNGILQDAYWRIMIVSEDTCHIPEDLEVSQKELEHILSRAERWRGKFGERRKIKMEKIVTTDENDPSFERTDLHVTIHHLPCGDADRWLESRQTSEYREFYLLESGAILEALGDSRPGGIAVSLFQADRTKQSQAADDAAGGEFGKSQSGAYGGDNPFDGDGGDLRGSASGGFFGNGRKSNASGPNARRRAVNVANNVHAGNDLSQSESAFFKGSTEMAGRHRKAQFVL